MENISENLKKWRDSLKTSSSNKEKIKKIFSEVIPKAKGSLKYKINKNTLVLSSKSVVRDYIKNKKDDLILEFKKEGILIEDIIFSILD